jgi:hypothetical protein
MPGGSVAANRGGIKIKRGRESDAWLSARANGRSRVAKM